MKPLFSIGSRVRYEPSNCTTRGPLVGTITAIYPAYSRRDDETGELIHYEAHAAVRPDALPDWWPYAGNDQFAPAISELRPIR